jgi:Acetyl xylan esterase (AXE1)
MIVVEKSNIIALWATILMAGPGSAQDADLAALLKKPILPPRQTLAETQSFCEKRVPRVPEFKDSAAWTAYVKKTRADVLANVVYRGEAAKWRDYQGKVEWLDTIPGGWGYQLKKLRFEALPGLWIPALLYEPEKLEGKTPAHLCVMGHDPKGKDVDYQQIRCINLVKRGMIALNVEWFNFGQLKGANFHHGRMNQLDLCGTSGLAPFYLSLKRGVDILLSHPHADPKRVSVSGLSGGGWQTIMISGLDERVVLSNPVAGYSSFLTRVRHLSDLGDSEQTPCDMAVYADYHHLTAFRAPQPTLLTFNAKDDCCFASEHALPPLMETARPFFRWMGKGDALRSHVNFKPGTHNYEQDNREAFYRMVGDFFFPGDKDFSAQDMLTTGEVRQAKDLAVPMPEKNHDFNSLAKELAKSLPRDKSIPSHAAAIDQKRALLRKLVNYHAYAVNAPAAEQDEKSGIRATYFQLSLTTEPSSGKGEESKSHQWTVPVVELRRGEAKETVIVLHDDGRVAAAAEIQKQLDAGKRVLAVDPFYWGESAIQERAYLFALLVGAVGERPLGIQASQVAAVARWSQARHKAPVRIVAAGSEICGLVAFVSAALEPEAIRGYEAAKSYKSLRDVIEQNLYYQQRPEVFCFGLLEQFDLPQIEALASR